MAPLVAPRLPPSDLNHFLSNANGKKQGDNECAIDTSGWRRRNLPTNPSFACRKDNNSCSLLYSLASQRERKFCICLQDYLQLISRTELVNILNTNIVSSEANLHLVVVTSIACWQRRAFTDNDARQSSNDASLGANGGVRAAISGSRTVLALGRGTGTGAGASTSRSGSDA